MELRIAFTRDLEFVKINNKIWGRSTRATSSMGFVVPRLVFFIFIFSYFWLSRIFGSLGPANKHNSAHRFLSALPSGIVKVNWSIPEKQGLSHCMSHTSFCSVTISLLNCHDVTIWLTCWHHHPKIGNSYLLAATKGRDCIALIQYHGLPMR